MRSAMERSKAHSSLRAERATLTLQPATGPPLRRGLDQFFHLGQGFSGLAAPLLRNVGVEQVVPKRAMTSEVDDHRLAATPGIHEELDARHFLERPGAHPHGL